MLAVKGKFRTKSSPFYGIFVLYLDDKNGDLTKASVLVTRDETVYNINPAADTVMSIENKIADEKMSGKYVQSISTALSDNLLNKGNTSFSEKLFAAIKKGDKTNYEKIINSVVFPSLTDDIQDLELQAYAEVITPEDLEEEEVTSEDELDVGDLNTPDGITLNVSLQLSAVRGKFILDLVPGDKIMVKIDKNQSQGSYFIDDMKLRDGTEILPTPGEIISLKKNEAGHTEVLVKLADGLFGKAVEEEGVKVRIYNPGIDGISKNLKIEKEETTPQIDKAQGINIPHGSSSSSTFNFIMIGLVILLSILVYFIINLI